MNRSQIDQRILDSMTKCVVSGEFNDSTDFEKSLKCKIIESKENHRQ